VRLAVAALARCPSPSPTRPIVRIAPAVESAFDSFGRLTAAVHGAVPTIPDLVALSQSPVATDRLSVGLYVFLLHLCFEWLLNHNPVTEAVVRGMHARSNRLSVRQCRDVAARACTRGVAFCNHMLLCPLSWVGAAGSAAALTSLLPPYPSTPVGRFACAWWVGHFAWESVQAWRDRKIEGPEYVFHGVGALFVSSLYTWHGSWHWMVAAYSVWEASTPFLHFRGWLGLAGRRGTFAYEAASLGLLVVFVWARIWHGTRTVLATWSAVGDAVFEVAPIWAPGGAGWRGLGALAAPRDAWPVAFVGLQLIARGLAFCFLLLQYLWVSQMARIVLYKFGLTGMKKKGNEGGKAKTA